AEGPDEVSDFGTFQNIKQICPELVVRQFRQEDLPRSPPVCPAVRHVLDMPVLFNESLRRIPCRLHIRENDFVCCTDLIHFALRAFRDGLLNVEAYVEGEEFANKRTASRCQIPID